MGLVLISLSKSIRWENKQKANENSFQNGIISICGKLNIKDAKQKQKYL